ncbi:MAG TPA: hypothetical protein PKO41_00220 [Dokdonella sp.]|uniref:hypothetical protein n=1 Tax=Dokdonella sp. TaxID=2291710 RepID=UPI0025C318BE|nr:hypothetical protein [Dokdonella sp.]MBX3691329.1 hypothetical protein [Dokdonella sp.]MCW5569095.1 hypothetical protein [Dokdonella sp.]HNR90823.1 hypothetical protein [Dokdonella sp.]
MHESTALPHIRRLLHELPEFEPEPRLWLDITATHRSRQRRRRQVLVGSGLALVASLVALVVLPPRGLSPASELDLWQARSQALEHQWQTLASLRGDARLRAQLRLIDGELQSAYDRGAGADELAPLWKQRSDALLDLINRGSDATALTRL